MSGAGEVAAPGRRPAGMTEGAWRRESLRRRMLVQWFNPWRAGVARQRALAARLPRRACTAYAAACAARDILGSQHAGAASLMLLARLARFHKRPPADVVPPAADGVRLFLRVPGVSVRSAVGSPSALCAEGDGGATRGLLIGVHRRGAA